MKELKYLLRALALVICVLCDMCHGGKVDATFTLCDSNTSPTEIKSYSKMSYVRLEY